ncbi:hypothetical protein GM182_00590 [bacterium 3DAC]|nr:hypothetical protein [Dictyoglomota bacterium]UZN22447.1 hypothetical protein GM182_00590 [bacterium 3DAC]
MLKRLWSGLLIASVLVGILYLVLGQEYLSYLSEDIRNRLDDIIDLIETEEMVKGGN